jgi:Tol biopolymer transport system component
LSVTPIVIAFGPAELPDSGKDAGNEFGRIGRTAPSAGPPAPPLPKVSAHRAGERAVIDYSFSSFPSGPRRPWLLLTSVKSARERYLPVTEDTRLRTRRGRIVQLVGLGRPPFRVLVSVIGRGGGRSPVISVPLGSSRRSDVASRGVEPSYTGKIVFASRGLSGSTSDLYVINADGSRLRQLTRDSQEQDGPSWSPDGKSIAYTTAFVGNDSSLVISAANGSRRRVLHHVRGYGSRRLFDAEWSPDGRSIAFTIMRGKGAEVWTAELDGRLRRVAAGFAFDPTWGPGGKRFAFATLGGIFTAGADGRNVRAVVGTSVSDSHPVWSPNGRWIAVRSPNADWQKQEADSLVIVSPSGAVRRRVISGGAIFPVAWSPESDAILCLRRAGPAPDDGHLVIVSLRTHRVSRLDATTGAFGSASWHR